MNKLEEYQKRMREVWIEVGGKQLGGYLELPEGCRGLVVFVHGSGSSRRSPRNQYVASCMSEVGLGTLLFDLLTMEEEQVDLITREYRFDIPMLAERLVEVTEWIKEEETLKGLKIGYIGSSTGAGAALIAAGKLKEGIDAVVSRGGRPDLAGEALREVTAPTLMLVGGLDEQVIGLNEEAKSKMTTEVELKLVEGATHLFEEAGKLEEVAELAAKYFKKYLGN